jgi:hypothetical protein
MKVSTATLLGVVAVAGVWLVAQNQSTPARKPIRETVVYWDTSPPPPSLKAMVDEAAAVVVGRHVGHPRLIETVIPGDTRADRSTAYEFQLTEVIKADPLLPEAGEVLSLVLPGGDKEYSDRISRLRIAESTPLRSGTSYVIFLARNKVRPELYPAWGIGSFFDLSNERVSSLDGVQRRHNDKARAEFIGELRENATKAGAPR